MAAGLALRGVKRKADTETNQPSRKAQRKATPVDEDSDADADADASGHSEGASQTSDGEGEEDDKPTESTPATSAKVSPRFPSDRKRDFYCPYEGCLKSYNRPVRLQEHLRSHTNERVWKCQYPPCTKDFLRETHLKHHIKSAHSGVRDHVCEWEGCGKSFTTGTRLRRHHTAHEGREKYKCSAAGCGKTFRKHSTLQQHISTVHEGQKPFACRGVNKDGTPCGARFDTASHLKSHKLRFHEGNKYWCDICSPEMTEGKTNQDVLSSNSPGVGFPTYSQLRDHIKAVHPPICKECGSEFTTTRGLAKHIEIQHFSQPLSERQTHLCPEPGCGRGFTKKGTLTVHIQTVHLEKRNFVCGVTDLSTSSAEKLPFWSKENVASCGKDFLHKGGLEEHVRTVHMGLPPFRKAHPVTATTSANPNKEKATRSKRKPKPSAISLVAGTAYAEDSSRHLPCLITACEYRFTREYDLDMHLQKHHGWADWEIKLLKAGQAGDVAVGFEYDESRAFEVSQGDVPLGPAMSFPSNHLQSTMDLNGSATTSFSDIPDDSLGRHIEEAALHGGKFWLGGNPEDDFQVDPQWEREQAEMRALCGDVDEFDGYDANLAYAVGYDSHFQGMEAFIDPLLR
ncbi:MAG: Strongly-conserved Zn-finger binding protein (TFIIIA) [Icmadophila ericetorum]|nr:Strongly-conserved Zn-finger binding protein (TFIIIA) [Icmadophila ericetorum]